jgi:uroporphyrinogen decarboxylase
MQMKHRDRVATALGHEAPDRCPMQISFTPEFATRLRKKAGHSSGNRHNPHGGGNSYELEIGLDEDLLLSSVGWANSYYSGDAYTDEWGVGWSSAEYRTPFGTGRYTEICKHPLSDDAAVASYRAPDPERPELYRDTAELLARFGSEYWIVGATVTTIFETAWALRGLEPLLIDMLAEPDLADTILDIPFLYHLAAARRLAGMGVDMIWTGDDVGSQKGMLISPETWRRFFKPRMARFISEVKAVKPDIKIAHHSDGNIEAIIPELIEIGLDVLNPIQPACLDPAMVKRRFGDRLCFWGSMDEQHTLPFGSPEDVRREVRLRLETIGAKGGLIIGPTHHVQLDTPMENFDAMVDEIRKTGYRR